jgi:hypothetical protein
MIGQRTRSVWTLWESGVGRFLEGEVASMSEAKVEFRRGLPGLAGERCWLGIDALSGRDMSCMVFGSNDSMVLEFCPLSTG